jgi:hypothetical protein
MHKEVAARTELLRFREIVFGTMAREASRQAFSTVTALRGCRRCFGCAFRRRIE